MKQRSLFTTIVHTYRRPALLKQAVEALQRQTYANLEIILINNGATPETVEYLLEVAAADHRVKLVHFEDNQFSWDDPSILIHVCWNAALAEATGEYVWIQQDDDLLADDYVEKMVALFQGNPECSTAAGLPVSIDIDGKVNQLQFRDVNLRPKYTPGRELALDYLFGNRKMFAAPGTIFTIKRDVLIQAGGYHRAVEDSHLYGIVPFGVTGFDPSALFYWRHHEDQHNKQLSKTGWIGIDEKFALLKEWQMEQRWSVFGTDVARKVTNGMYERECDHAATWFVFLVYSLNPRVAIRICLKMWFRPHFWKQVFVHARERRYYIEPVALVVKPLFKYAFRIWPSLAKLTPALSRLSEKVNRWN